MGLGCWKVFPFEGNLWFFKGFFGLNFDCCLFAMISKWKNDFFWSLGRFYLVHCFLEPIASDVVVGYSICHLLRRTTPLLFYFSFSFFSLSPSILPTIPIFPFLHFLLPLIVGQQCHTHLCRSWCDLVELTMPPIVPTETHTFIFNFLLKN